MRLLSEARALLYAETVDLLFWRWEQVKAGNDGEQLVLRGFLVERAPDVYTFPHRTFQECLAGAHLSTQAGFAHQATALLTDGPC